MTQTSDNQIQKTITIGILAHVDAGKTTLSEEILYETGVISHAGRVDHKDTVLDNDEMERARGITIFSKQAVFSVGDTCVTLLDTPGHVDFSAETERTLQVLDYAILVISAADGISAHTKTLWKLLRAYRIPVFLFVNKMDQDAECGDAIFSELKTLSDRVTPFSEYQAHAVRQPEDFYENIAAASEEESVLEQYLAKQVLPDSVIADLIRRRLIFPCYFGSALKGVGVSELLDGIRRFTADIYREKASLPFGARVFKISRDEKGIRLSHIKVMQGQLSVRQEIADEKVTQIRIYCGESYQTVSAVSAGCVCTVAGLETPAAGDGLGVLTDNPLTYTEPVISYSVSFGSESARKLYPKLAELDDELPELHLQWDEETETVRICLMGPVQIEILTELIRKRCGVVPEFDSGRILYKETVAAPVIGVGHFEPLRHYAEVHIRIEPAELGSGTDVAYDCREEVLAKNWQRLIGTHLTERVHRGVAIGAPLTDVHFTVIGGRAHNKHTEGGDFRQATYRAVRQGLMTAGTVILEPKYNFTLEIPSGQLGHALTDLQTLYAVPEAPEITGEKAVIRGYGPVATLRDYQLRVREFTRGEGVFSVSFGGYMPCHNEEEVTATFAYDPESDLANPSCSVFCAHGSGFLVPWDQVRDYMHVEDDEDTVLTLPESRQTAAGGASSGDAIGTDEIDAILAAQTGNRNAKKKVVKKIVRPEPSVPVRKNSAAKKPVSPKEQLLIVDGCNVIFAWEELRTLAETNFHAAKDRLIMLLSNYQGNTGIKVLLVFDGYKVKGNHGSDEISEDIRVIHTKEDETADRYIEAYTHRNNSRFDMTVVTSDGLIQTITRGAGCRILSSREFYEIMQEAAQKLRDLYHIDAK